MAKKYDVIVVGAGPAGFMAARTAGENGLDVALLEKKTDITSFNRSCAQTLVSATEPYLGKLVVLNSRLLTQHFAGAIRACPQYKERPTAGRKSQARGL